MKQLLPRYIPKGSMKVASKKSPAVAYLSTNSRGKPTAIGYFGNATNASFNYSFRDEQRRAQYVGEWIRSMDAVQAGRDEAKAAKKALCGKKQEFLKVGDVLSCSWGYDQTNVEYFQVVELVGLRKVKIQPIASESIETGFMQGKCVPAVGQFTGEPMLKVVSDSGSVRIYSFASAYKVEPVKVDGVAIGYKPANWTSYA
jgi:hypothetical protein